MEKPAEIVFQGTDKSDAVEARIHERIARLEQRHDRLIGCRVFVRGLHRRHRQGNLYTVDIELSTPLTTLAIGRRPGDDNAHEDVFVAIRDAFDAMERRLLKLKQKHDPRPTAHDAALQGRIDEIDHERGDGEIATTDGRLVYFHRNAVLNADFESLAVGDAVELVVHARDSAKGPHASSVRPISAAKFVSNPKPRT